MVGYWVFSIEYFYLFVISFLLVASDNFEEQIREKVITSQACDQHKE